MSTTWGEIAFVHYVEKPREYTGECIPKVILADLLQCTDQLATGRLDHCSLLETAVSLTVRHEKAIGHSPNLPYSNGIGSPAGAIPLLKVV